MATATEPHVIEEDEPTEATRYGIYVIEPPSAPWASDGREKPTQRRIAETSQDGIGMTLVTLRTDDPPQITHDDRVGIRDRIERKWIVNPWATGDRPRAGRPRPDYDTRIDHPERYTDGPV